jgi:hypothetical protein
MLREWQRGNVNDFPHVSKISRFDTPYQKLKKYYFVRMRVIHCHIEELLTGERKK